MTLDSESQRAILLHEIKNEELRSAIKIAKVIAPWVPEHVNNRFAVEDRAQDGN